MAKVFKFNELDLTKITYSEPDFSKINPIIYTHYDEMDSLLIETPELYCIDKIDKKVIRVKKMKIL